MKNFLIILSLANMCFIASWRAVLYPPFYSYHLQSVPTGINALGLMLDVLFFTSTIWVIFILAKRGKEKYLMLAARFAFLFLVIDAINNIIRESFGTLSMSLMASLFGKGISIAILSVVIIFAGFALIKWSRQISRVAQIFVLLMSPFVLLTFSHSSAMIVENNSLTASSKVSASSLETNGVNNQSKKRIVWIIFDEFDYRAAFSTRPSTLKLPELDRFASQSFFATNAFPPAGETLVSLPALLTGKLVAKAQQKSFDELSLNFADGNESVDWKSQPNIFSTLKTTGGQSALVGWYHPYCRLFQNNLSSCTSRTQIPDVLPNKHLSNLAGSMKDYFWRFLMTVPLLRDFLPKYKDSELNQSYNGNFIEINKFLDEQAVKVVANPQFSFVFIHLPGTHHPYFYNQQTQSFDIHKKTNYFDSLALNDKVFGDFRRAMEQSGVWNDSVVIVSSDHWWRTIDWENQGVWSNEETAVAQAEKDFRIPFMIKLPKSNQNPNEKQFAYQPVFNTVLSHDLILAINRGEISTNNEISSWLDRHRSTGVSGF